MIDYLKPEDIPTVEQVLELVLKSQPDKPVGKVVAMHYIKHFCGLHVTAALQAAAEKAVAYDDPNWRTEGGASVPVEKDSILNAYPENNIL